MDYRADGEFFGGFQEAFKDRRFGFGEKEGFQLSTGGFPPVDTEGIDSCVVHDEQVAGLEEFGDFSKLTVDDFAGMSAEVEKAAGISFGKGSLGDEIFGEVVVEIVEVHR